MTSRLPAQCMYCQHWISPLDRTDENAREDRPTQVCAAFPLDDGGIPDEIWWNRADHREAARGDHGIRWESEAGHEFPDWAMAK